MNAAQTVEVYCPHCRGGNPPTGTACIWCGQAIRPAARAGSPLLVIGVGLLLVGVFVSMCFIMAAFMLEPPPGTNRATITFAWLVFGFGALLFLVVPGALVLLANRRRR